MAKLKKLLSEAFEDTPKLDKHQVIEGVKSFGIVGHTLYNNNNIVEIANQLSQIAESAHNHIIGEQDDWFDKISVNKNMKSLKGSVVEFQKAAKEAHMLNQRLTGLYEDIGLVLNRYYEIDESVSEDADSAHKMMGKYALDVDHEGRPRKGGTKTAGKTSKKHDTPGRKPWTSKFSEDAGDMDNDGKNEPDDEEYLDNKDKAIKKAMKQTKESIASRKPIRLKDLTSNIVSLRAVGGLSKKI